MFGWKKKKKQDELQDVPPQDAEQAIEAGMGETLVPGPDDVLSDGNEFSGPGDDAQAAPRAIDDDDVLDWFDDGADGDQPPAGDGGTLVPDFEDDAIEDAASDIRAQVEDLFDDEPPSAPEPPTAPPKPAVPRPASGTGTILPSAAVLSGDVEGFSDDSDASAGSDSAGDDSDDDELSIDDGTLSPATHDLVRDRFDEDDSTSSGDVPRTPKGQTGTILPTPNAAVPRDSGDDADSHAEGFSDDILDDEPHDSVSGGDEFSDMDTAPTFVPGMSDAADDDLPSFEESETVVPGEPAAAAVAATVAGSGSIDDATTIFNQSIGQHPEDAVADETDSDSDDDRKPSSLMSLMGKSSHHGLDRSLRIRSRPVRGEEPFSAAPDADYEIIEKLAEGGMGIVYIAKQTSLSRQLAIKTLKPLSESEKKEWARSNRMSQMTRQRREMFLSEALVTANLVHPNIVPIHDLCQTDGGIPFYSMKHVEGKPWNKHVTTMTEEENLDVLLKVADAVAYAHHNGVVNRDLKPENIMLGEFGEVVVLDWGLAIPAPDAGQSKFSTSSSSFGAGTPAYMSPELWTGPPEKIGKHSDIYLLGAMLFEIVTGLPPHEFPAPPKGSSKTTVMRIIDSVVRPNEIRETDIESELLDIARKAMETEPEDRYQSVQEFQVAVRDYLQHEESRHLSQRADSVIAETEKSKAKGYSGYQTATALYREALVGWPENFYAKKGLHNAQLKYAQLAHDRGDYDLGLQLVSTESGRDFEALGAKLTKAKRRRGLQKWTTIGLLGVIMVAGPAAALKFKRDSDVNAAQRDEIKALAGSVEDLNTQKSSIEKETIALRQETVTLAGEATQARNDAELAKTDASKAKSDAEQARADALDATRLAQERVDQADMQVMAANSKLNEANVQLAAVDTQLAAAAEAIKAAEVKKAEAERQATQAEFEKRTEQVSSLTIQRDYRRALQEIDILLTEVDQQLEEPQADEAAVQALQDRRRELEAQREQLSRRATQTGSSVEFQQISPDGTTVVWCDRENNITIRRLSAAGEVPDDFSAQKQIPGDVTDLKLLADGSTVLATAGSSLHVWNYETGDLRAFTVDVDANIQPPTLTAIETAGGLFITGDNQGRITAWQPNTGASAWTYETDTPVRSLRMMPGADILLIAGSRADRSAVVMALKLQGTQQPPQRHGQLLYSDSTNRPPKALQVSPDGRTLVVGNSRNGDLLVLPLKPNGLQQNSAQQGNSFPFVSPRDQASGWHVTDEHSRPVNSIAFSADGNLFVTASDDRTVKVWRVQHSTGAVEVQVEETLEGHGAAVTSAAFIGPSPEEILSTSKDRYARRWKWTEYQQFRKAIDDSFSKEVAPAAQVDVAPHDEGRPVSQVTPRQSRSRYMLTVLPADQPDQPFIVLNDDSKASDVGEPGLRGGIRSIDLTADGSRLAGGGGNGAAMIWETSSGEPVASPSESTSKRTLFHDRSRLLEEGHKFNVSRLQFLPPDQSLLLTASFDGSVCLWQADPADPSGSIELNRVTDLGLINAAAASPDGKLLVTSLKPDLDAKTYGAGIWDVNQLITGATPELRRELKGFHRGVVTSLAFSPDGQWVTSGAADGRIALWSAATGEQLASVSGHDKDTIVSGLEWVDPQYFLSAGLDGKVKLWNVEQLSASEPARITVETTYQTDRRAPVDRLVASPTGEQFLTITVTFGAKKKDSSGDRETYYNVVVWNTGEPRRLGSIRLAAYDGRVPESITSASWSDDGSRVAVVTGGPGRTDDRINIVDTSNWKVMQVLKSSHTGITDAVYRRGAAGNGQFLATFDGNAAHLWNLETYGRAASFRPQDEAAAIALSHDDDHRFVAVGSRALRIYNSQESSDAYAQTLVKVDRAHRRGTRCLEFAPVANDYRLLSGGGDGVVKLWIWNPADQSLQEQMKWELSLTAATDVRWSEDAATILAVTEDSAWLLRPDDPIPTAIDIELMAGPDDGPVKFNCGAISFSGEQIALGGELTNSGASVAFILQRDTATNALLQHTRFSGHGAGGISQIDFVPEPDSPYVVTTGIDGAAIIWNWHPRDEPGSAEAHMAYRFLAPNPDLLDAHRAGITDLAVSSNGIIATSSDDGTAIVWQNPLSTAISSNAP